MIGLIYEQSSTYLIKGVFQGELTTTSESLVMDDIDGKITYTSATPKYTATSETPEFTVD